METKREELRKASMYLYMAAAEAGVSDLYIALRIREAIQAVEGAMNPAKPIQEQEVAT